MGDEVLTFIAKHGDETFQVDGIPSSIVVHDLRRDFAYDKGGDIEMIKLFIEGRELPSLVSFLSILWGFLS